MLPEKYRKEANGLALALSHCYGWELEHIHYDQDSFYQEMELRFKNILPNPPLYTGYLILKERIKLLDDLTNEVMNELQIPTHTWEMIAPYLEYFFDEILRTHKYTEKQYAEKCIREAVREGVSWRNRILKKYTKIDCCENEEDRLFRVLKEEHLSELIDAFGDISIKVGGAFGQYFQLPAAKVVSATIEKQWAQEERAIMREIPSHFGWHVSDFMNTKAFHIDFVGSL